MWMGNSERIGMIKLGQLEGLPEKKDILYAAFNSAQRAHDCPGFDCAICSQCFDNLIAEYDALEVELDASAIKDIVYKLMADEDISFQFTGPGRHNLDLLDMVSQAIANALPTILRVKNEK